MKKTTAILIVLLFALAIVLLVIFGKEERVSEDFSEIQVTEDKVKASYTALEEFQELRTAAKTFTSISADTEEVDNGKKICDKNIPANCLTINYSVIIPGWVEARIYLIDKPEEGDMYAYDQLGDIGPVVQYVSGSWKVADIEYLKNVKEDYLPKISQNPYTIFTKSDGDGGWSGITFIIDPKIESFPYWVNVMYSNDCCTDTEGDVSEKLKQQFIESLQISHY